MIVTRIVAPYSKNSDVRYGSVTKKISVGCPAFFKVGKWGRLVYQDTSVGQLTKDDDRGGVRRVTAFGACSRLTAAPHFAGNRATV